MSKRPSFQFYPYDYSGSSKLKSCSLAAQGLWVRLMCEMHASDNYGRILLKQMFKQNMQQTVKQNPQQSWENCTTLALNCCCNPVEFTPLLRELFEAEIAKIDEEGNIFSSRMVKDEYLRGVRSEAGSQGGKKTSKKFAKAKRQAKVKQMVVDVDVDVKEEVIEKERTEKFIKPTIQQICQYFSEQNFNGINQVEAERFFDHYTSNGWKVGKNPMKDWKAAIRNWIKNNSQFNSNKNGHSTHSKQTERERNANEIDELGRTADAVKLAIVSKNEPLSQTGS